MSAFKELVTSMFNNGGDFSKFSSAQKSQTIKCYVKESFPYFLVSDNFHYVQVYFTKKAVDDFKAKNSKENITDLKTRVINITDWSLEMNQVNSQDVFTSYGGLEVRLVARAFNVAKGSEKVILSRHPTNLYRDAEVKTTIQNFTHGRVVAAAAGAKSGLPDISGFKNNGSVNQGVVSATTKYDFKEGKSAFVSLETVFKQEKGTSAFNNLNKSVSSGKVVVKGASKASKGIKKPASTKKGAVNALMRTGSATNKRSAVFTGGKPNVATPRDDGNRGSAQISSMKDFRKMVTMIKKQKTGKASRK